MSFANVLTIADHVLAAASVGMVALLSLVVAALAIGAVFAIKHSKGKQG